MTCQCSDFSDVKHWEKDDFWVCYVVLAIFSLSGGYTINF